MAKVNLKAKLAHEMLSDIIPDSMPKAYNVRGSTLSASEYREVVTQAFTEAEHKPRIMQVRYAYEAFAYETVQQFKLLLTLGFKFHFTFNDPVHPVKKTPSYNYTLSLFENGGVLPVFRTELGEHALLADTAILNYEDFEDAVNTYGIDVTNITFDQDLHHGEWFLTVNDIFRAVHDTLGHMASGSNFSQSGEERAYLSHSRLYSPLARKALFSETVGQNSYYNTHKEYAPQKCTILDPELYGLY